MTDASETLNWHKSQFRKHWTEPRPAPLTLTDTEVLDWMAEYCELVSYVRPTDQYTGGYTLDVDYISPTKGATLREAVCLAAAKLNEVNE